MADVIISNELGQSASEYEELARNLQGSIDHMDETMQRMVSGAIMGEQAPQSIINLWTGGGDNPEGVKGAMMSYVTKLYEVAGLVQNVVADAQSVDMSNDASGLITTVAE